MLSHSILEFLKTLSVNNNRDWFNANKSWYDEAKQEFELFVNVLIAEISKFDPSIRTVNAKESIYRIYRDTRFSNDKTPYKLNFGAHIVQNGRKSGLAGYYLHIEPGDCFLGGGIYLPSSPILKTVRTEIFANIQEFKNIIHNPDFQKQFPQIYGKKLKKAPKDFPADFLDVDLLKYKSYTILKPYPENRISTQEFMPFVMNTMKTMQPFNRFINRAILEGAQEL